MFHRNGEYVPATWYECTARRITATNGPWMALPVGSEASRSAPSDVISHADALCAWRPVTIPMVYMR